VTTRSRKAQASRRLTIGAISVALHGLLAWALLASVPEAPTLVEPRSVTIALVQPERQTPRAPPSTAASAPAALIAPLHRPPLVPPPLGSPAPITTPPGAIIAPPGFTARGTPTGGGETLRQAARQSACTEADVVKLTKAEREACAERLGAKNKNGPALYAAIDPDKKAAFDGDCKKDDDWCLYRSGKGPYPGLFALGKKRKIKGWD
jgi:hypothetical protein